MTVWRLPDLTGLELREADRCVLHGVDAVSLELPDGRGYVDLPMAVLVEVKPSPLPPEPRNFSTVRVGARAYVRDDNASHLSWAGPDGRREWSELCDLAMERTGFPPVLLVPAPEPVELPWEHRDPEGYPIGVHESQRDWAAARVGQRDACADLTASACRDMARALWSAADAFEAQS